MAPSDDVEIVEVDPRDEAAFACWFAVVAASEELERPGEPGSLLEEERRSSVAGTGDDPDVRRALLMVRDGRAVVAAGRLELPQRDNLHLCETTLVVHPACRRRGIGRVLAAELEARVRAAGRNTLLAWCDEPPGWQGRLPGRLGGLGLGFEVVQEEVRRDIDLPLPATRVAELERTGAPYAVDYELRTWWDACPDDLVDDLSRLVAAMSTDVPKDRMDWQPEAWDAARIRRDEALGAAMGRTHAGAGAVHRPSGRLVAFTRMGIARSQPARAHQWETLVLREHRGHRLGMLVKLAALQLLARREQPPAFISTWNAQENAPMIAVNDALGARLNGRLALLQKRV